ncbi:MAG: DHH family phosphoesterase [Patescibacteria group bacterium]
MLTEDQQIIDQIEKAKKILITFRRDYTGDAVASALALYLFLKKMDKQVSVAADNFNPPHIFSFLSHINKVQSEVKTDHRFVISLDTTRAAAKEISYQIKDGRLEFIITPKDEQFRPEEVSAQMENHSYDLVIVISSPDLESLGKIYHHNTDFFFNTPVINIDHHAHNEEFGQINKVKITAISTTEILFDLFNSYAAEVIDSELATYLLTGIFAESKSFKTGALTPNTLLTASKLIALGADRETIVRNLYQSRDFSTLKLWGRTLARLKSDLDGKLIWSSLNKVDFAKSGGNADCLNEVVEELVVNIPEAEVIVLMIEQETNQTDFCIHTTRNINAQILGKDYEATGSKNSAKASCSLPLIDAETEIIAAIKNKLAKLPV